MRYSLIAIDFEASCLPRHGRSFPIEVGIADLNGWSQSWIIRPCDDWMTWDWTLEAQNLHGLDRDCLRQQGLPPAQVVAELARAVGGRRVVADSHLDFGWLKTLATAAGVIPPFRVDHVAQLTNEWNTSPEDIAAALGSGDALPVRRHRAEGDALWLARIIASLESKTRPIAA